MRLLAICEGGRDEALHCGDGYIFYHELSGDAAHPSATSLSRHVTWSGEGDDARFTVHAVPVQDHREVEDTLELLCTAVLGVCVAANQIVDSKQSGERLDALFTDFRQLSDASKAAREDQKPAASGDKT